MITVIMKTDLRHRLMQFTVCIVNSIYICVLKFSFLLTIHASKLSSQKTIVSTLPKAFILNFNSLLSTKFGCLSFLENLLISQAITIKPIPLYPPPPPLASYNSTLSSELVRLPPFL